MGIVHETLNSGTRILLNAWIQVYGILDAEGFCLPRVWTSTVQTSSAFLVIHDDCWFGEKMKSSEPVKVCNCVFFYHSFHICHFSFV